MVDVACAASLGNGFLEGSHLRHRCITEAMKLLLAFVGCAAALQLNAHHPAALARRATAIKMDDIPQVQVSDGNVVTDGPAREKFYCEFEIPKKGISEYGTVQMNFMPLLATKSELVVVRYDLPFGLNAEPDGRVVRVTQDGAEGKEKVGDILRFTLKWNQNEPSMFDVCKCMERQLQNSFDQVVAALVSNDGTYAEEIVMIFERPLE